MRHASSRAASILTAMMMIAAASTTACVTSPPSATAGSQSASRPDPLPDPPPTNDIATPAAAELVLRGGRIVTLDDERPEVEALAIRDGRIVAVGPRSEVEPLIGPLTKVIDLPAGALAMPGLHDAHAHFLGLGDMRAQIDLRDASSFAEIVRRVTRAASEAPLGSWIRGRGWHQEKWATSPEAASQKTVEGFPVHDALSAAVPDHPVLLTHASGHALLANAEAMRLAGIDPADGDGPTPDPAGGEILRDAEGRPTGLFNETAQGLIHAARGVGEGSWPEAEMRRMIALASEESLSKGLTSFHDAGSPPAVVEALRRAALDGRLGVRLWVMLEGSNERLAEVLPEARVEAEETDHMLAVGGIKRYMDGALGSRGAWLLAPYHDEPTTTGLALSEIDDLHQTARLALEHDLQLCVHGIGDRAVREILDVFETGYQAAGAADGVADLRWRIEHAQHIDPEDIRRFSSFGIVASMQPVHATSDGPWVPDRLGDERSEAGAYVWRKLLDSGAVIVSGTDAPVEDVDPLENFYAAVTRRLNDGSRFYPRQAMTREEALATLTRDAAWSVFQDEDKGTLTVGKLGDVTVLSKDILTVPEDSILDADVLYTIVGGEVAYEQR